MRRRLRPGIAALGALAILVLPAAAGAAGPSNLQCNGTYSGTYANVTVPANGVCNLQNATVLGNAVVLTGGSLNLGDPSGAVTINGNVAVGRNGSFSQPIGSTVGGTITGQGASSLAITGGTTHDILANATADIEITSATVDGSLVANQTQDFGSVGANLAITGDVIVNAEPSSAAGFYIDEQPIGGSVDLTNNQAPTVVYLNTIQHNLVCTGNKPPPSDFGYGNYVRGREVGQCAGLTSNPGDGAGSD